MYIDKRRQFVRTRVAGAISSDGCVRTVLAGESVRISTYVDNKGLKWTTATWDYDDSDDLELIEPEVRRALKIYCQNYIKEF